MQRTARFSALVRVVGQQHPGSNRARFTGVSPVFRQGVASTQTANNISRRAFASAGASKIAQALASEIKHEEQQYEQSKEVKKFLESGGWKLEDTAGDVNMALTKKVGDKTVKIEFQLTSPFDPSADTEGGAEGDEQEATEFCVTIESQSNAGVSFYCSTQPGEDHRYVIGNVRSFSNAQEKESDSGYNGPDFEDIDEKLQEAFDEYLAEVGMDSQVCNFIDAVALDKEQREYIGWLKNSKVFFGA